MGREKKEKKEKKKKKRREKNQSALYIQHCSQDCYNLLRISFGTFVFYPESHSTKNHSTRCDGNGKCSFFKTSFSWKHWGKKRTKRTCPTVPQLLRYASVLKARQHNSYSPSSIYPAVTAPQICLQLPTVTVCCSFATPLPSRTHAVVVPSLRNTAHDDRARVSIHTVFGCRFEISLHFEIFKFSH